MSRRGRTIAVLSILTLVVGIVLGALPAQAANGNDGEKQIQPATHVGINYPGFPTRYADPNFTGLPMVTGGPYIVTATYRPGTVTGGDPDVLVVFNKDVNIATFAVGDLVGTGFTYTGILAGPTANTVRLTPTPAAGAGDLVRLATPQAIAGADGTLSSDVSQILLGTGPVICKVQLTAGYGDTLLNNDQILLTFDANIQYGSGDSEDNTFWQTPEFNYNASGDNMLAANAPVANTLTLQRDAAAPRPFRFIEAGVTKIWMDATRIRWVAVATENSSQYVMPVELLGPYVTAVYYSVSLTVADSTDDRIFVVTNNPFDPIASNVAAWFPTTAFNTNVDGGGFFLAGGQGTVSSLFQTDYSSVFELIGFDQEGSLPDEATDTWQVNGAQMVNYQDMGSVAAAAPVVVFRGPGIVRASYDDRRTSARTDDQLYIWLSEAVSSPGAIEIADFTYTTFNTTGLSLVTDVVGTMQRITISGFTTTNYPRPGARVRANAPNGVFGIYSGGAAADEMAGGATAPWIQILDESRPYTVQIVESNDLTYDRWNNTLGIDSVFVAWSEAGADDSDQYFLFVTKENPNNIDASWMNAKLPTAISLGNLRPAIQDGGTAFHRVAVLLDPTEGAAHPGALTQSMDDVSPDLVDGDQIYLLVAAADFQGNLSLRFDQNSTANHLFGAFLVGPLCQPRDFITDTSVPADPDSVDWDHDVIHVVGDSTATGIAYYVYGDPGAIPCSADSVVAFRVSAGVATADWLGAVPVNSDGSFYYIDLDETRFLAGETYIFLRTKTDVDYSDPTPIILDRTYPNVLANAATPFADFIFDPWNPHRIYNDGDYVNLRAKLGDYFLDSLGVTHNGLSALIHGWADFTRLDLTAGNIAGFGVPADSIPLVSLGNDQVDNDRDWLRYTDSNGDGNYDIGEPLNDDVGLDGVGGTQDTGEGDGVPTFGDAYIDENGNGVFDPGETFIDRVRRNGVSSGYAIFDPGEPDLDCMDADEFGWYEVRNTTSGTIGTIKQGYVLDNPNPDARLWPFTPVKLWIEDNGIAYNGGDWSPPMDGSTSNYHGSYPQDRVLPYKDLVNLTQAYTRTLYQVTTHRGPDTDPWDPERSFLTTIDLQPPTVAEITGLFQESGAFTNAGVNEIVPGNPTYHMGRYIDFTTSTFSDADVVVNRAQVKVGSTWRDLNLDPSVASGAANDGNADGFPGSEGYDEDADSTATRANGLDDDGDGLVDEIGEGIDFSDLQVYAASIDSAGNAASANPVAMTAQNDYRDNDNDAFFLYDSYANGGLVGGAAGIGKITWYNIDESTTNNFDDDNDGSVDESDEAVESVGYGTGVNDDNEDGIVNGEAVALAITGFNRLAGDDATSGNFRDAHGFGVAAAIYVDAAHIFGTRPLAGTDPGANYPKFYANATAYTEAVTEAFEMLTASSRTFIGSGYQLAGANDSLSAVAFNWQATHFATTGNLDLELISMIHGLAADGVTEYGLRTLAYDKSGNMATAWTEPIEFTFDLTGPAAAIPGCEETGDPPPDFADVSGTLDGVQIWDSGKHPGKYTLTATAGDDAVKVYFYASTDPDLADILATTPVQDVTAPFTTQWPFPPATGMFSMDNYPYDHQQTWYFVAVAEDQFGNITPDADLCIFDATVLDGTPPIICLAQVGHSGEAFLDADLRDGAVVPPDSSIDLFVYQQAAPLPGRWDDADGIDWVGGLDREPGVAGFDDDGDGTADEDDVDGDGIFTAGVDDDGADDIPGTNDDEWNGSATSGNLGETDDYVTNDIVYVVFQMNPVGDDPDQGWITFATVHGDTNSVPGQVIDWTEPVKATWNTHGLPTGDYDLRAWGVDWEGNSNELTACITTVGIRAVPLRAYIQPEVCVSELTFSLYAVHYIHDYEIDKVRFEYYYDADGNDCADDGNAWTTIALDDQATGRGDAVLYPGSTEIEGSDAIEDLVYRSFGGTSYMFYDADSDGYSQRDPVINDIGVGNAGVFGTGDAIVIGADADVPSGATLTAFAANEFWAEAEADGLEPTDWIFRENELTGTNGVLNLWNVSWDATGLPEGNYLVRSIAIDENNEEDVIAYFCYDPTQQNPEEIEAIQIDTVLPNTNITTLTLPDGSEIDVSAMAIPPYINGNTKWVMVTAEGDDDTARMLFEYSLDGGLTWTSIDVNNDDDFFSNLDGLPGFQALDVDEVFNDLNGNYVYDDGIDFVRYDGGDGVDTPDGWPLLPLIGEDGGQANLTDGVDDDGDTFTDEADEAFLPDGVNQDGDQVVDEDFPANVVLVPPDGENPEDYNPPFAVYLDISVLDLLSDVNVLLRATASDLVCNDVYRADPTPDILAVIVGENQQPEADVIRAEDLDGVEVDVRPEIMDQTGVATIGAGMDTMRVFVTAEDASSVVAVDLFYRLDPACYDLSIEEMQWKSMSTEGWTLPDSTYPYDFNVATDPIPDGVYQFYPRAYDANETYNDAPVNPWGFKKFEDAGEDFAFVSQPAPPPAEPDHAAPGDEYTIHGSLIDPSVAPTTAVQFFYAPRILDESIDASAVQPLVPYTSEAVARTILGAATGDGVVLTVNGTALTFGVDYDIVGGDQIVFDVRPDNADEILISYNFGAWSQINTGDSWSPYTVAWSQADGGVPEPGDPITDAYDLIAIARFDLNGDGVYGTDCDYQEPLASEGNYLILDDQERPNLILYGLAYNDFVAPFDYLDWNWPGNPLFRSGDELSGPNYENKLSGIESDVFVVAADVGGGSIVSVSLDITSSEPAGKTLATTHIDMDEYSAVSTIDIPITLYEDDFPQWLPGGQPTVPGSFENVILQVSTDGGASWAREYQMVRDAATGTWSADGRFNVGITDSETQQYQFLVDLVGDEQAAVADPRNRREVVKDAAGFISALDVPSTPFWYAHIDNPTQLTNNAVHTVLVTATDDSGNWGTNLNSEMPGEYEAQGPIVFIWDNTAPVVNEISVTNEDNQPLNYTRVSPQVDYILWANVSDSPFTDLNVMSLHHARFEYTPNNGGVWLHIGTDADPLDGQWHVDWSPINGETDGYDNDGDGLWDEDDEVIYTTTIRVIAMDDGMNSTYSDRQSPAVTLVLTVDAAEPTAALTTPEDGEVFGYAEAIALSGTAEGDYLPAFATNDVDEVRFQAKINRYYYVDQVYNGVGHGGYYDNGIDEVWFDNDGGGTFNAGDVVKFAGQDGTPAVPNGADVNYWFDLDPTPQDNSDFPRLTDANGPSDAWEMTWTPAGFSFITADELGGDEYVRLRMLSRDTAGNWDTLADLFGPPETLIILNDDTVMRAYVTHVGTNDQEGAVDPVEVKPIQAINPVTVYGSYFGADEITQVNLYLVTDPDKETVQFIGADNDLVDDEFEILWDATLLPEDVYGLFATAIDVDQNESDPALATRVFVRIDRTAPSVNYTPVGSYNGFATSASYTDDGIPSHSSLVIVPDPLTADVNFMVTTPDADVATMVLQWRWATDPVGLWRPWAELFDDGVPANGMFDYEPNLDFVADGVTHHFWWLHLENYVDQFSKTGRMEFRALATDEAGNTNALQTTWAQYTADNLPPTGFDWNDDTVTNQIEVGTTVNFEISLQDALMTDDTRTDVVSAILQYRVVGTTTWLTWDETTPEGVQIDSGNAMWIARFAWTAPDFVVHDTAYEFQVVMIDSAGNADEWSRPSYTITVEDNAAPDRTKIVDVVAQVYVTPDAGPALGGPAPPDENEDVWKDLNGNATFQLGSDWVISEGDDFEPPQEPDLQDPTGEPVGDPCATSPRNVGESFLNDPQIRNVVKVARTVTIVGRTQSDDDGIGQLDTGIQTVTFVLQPVDANGNPVGDPYTLGVDEYRPGFPLFYWHYHWDTTVYPNGTYRLGCWAMDEEGNIEDQTTLDWTAALIQIDNEPPTAQMDADATTETVEKTASVERNSIFTLFARTLVPGTATLQNYEDDEVEFWYKRSRDLNMEDSWGVVPNDAEDPEDGEEDGNPDPTRPYSFDVAMGMLPDPTYPYGQDVPVVPLAVGEYYDFCVAVQDEVCNVTDVISGFADSTVTGVGTRYIRLLIQDTIAPHLEFTYFDLNGECHDDNDNPTAMHARGFDVIEARLLTGALDMDHAEFVYRLKGTTTWNLIDADLTPSEDLRTWTLGNWDLRTLQHGAWYEVGVIGVDDVGNVDPNPDIIEVYVDYEAPPSDLVSPVQDAMWCNGVLDLVVHVDRGAEQQHDDVCDVIWLWKASVEADVRWDDPEDWAEDGWSSFGVARDGDLYDDTTNYYSNTLDLDVQDSSAVVFPTNLYDLQAIVMDDAGNTTVVGVTKAVVDKEAPDYVQISNIKWNGDDTTQDPNDDGQYTDVTAGTLVEIFGTASDDEESLPNLPDPQNGRFYETMIAWMQFQVAYDLNADGNVDDGTSWHDLGVIHLEPPDLGDMSAQTASVQWNTTGLPEGQYLLRVIAGDECGNSAESEVVNVRVVDWTPPIARVVAWDADQQPHGDPAPSFLTIYVLAESDTTDADPEEEGWQPTYDVQVQFEVREAGETAPSGDWINLGIALPADSGDEFTTEHIWYATVDPLLFGDGVSSVWLRALVKDENGNRYGDNPEDIIPTVAADIVLQVDGTDTPEVIDGTWTMEQIRAAELQGGSEMIENVSWRVESPTHLVVTLDMTVQDQTPRVVLLNEPYEPVAYPSWDGPRNYSPGVRRNGQLVGLTRSIDDPTIWRGEIFLEDPGNCTHYALWVSALDGISGTAKWVDLDNVFMREFRVTTALGTNGTVDTPGIEENPGVQVMVPSGGWPQDPACLLTSPTDPPLISTDQSRYLSPIDLTAYHLEMLSGSNPFVRGYEPLVKIYYDEALALAALQAADDPDLTEDDITVRRWDPSVENRDGTTGAWVGTGISHIKVYPDADYLAFRVRDLLGQGGAGGGGGTDLAFTLDGSGSIDAADFTLQLEGVAAALEDASIIPRDGSVAVCVVQFGSGAATEIPLTRITSAGVATTLATEVRAIVQSGDGTPMDAGIDEAVVALGNGTQGASQVIVLSTDGAPDDAQLALQAADDAVNAGVESLFALGVGSGADMTFLAQIVRGGGTATPVASFTDYAQAVSTMISDIIVGSQSGGGNVFQLFAPKRNAPVVLSNMWPNSPYVTDWWTDADPVIVVYLRDPGGQVIDPYEAELLIDGEYWATWLDGDGAAEFIRGNGRARLTYANQDETVMELVYHHSTFPRDWLTDGRHILTVRYKADNGTDQWMESNFEFHVDRKSPYIEFDGGFVSNPRLINVKGYMNPNNTRLVAKMYDGGTGILFKHDRPWFYADFDCDGILNPNERQFDPVPVPDTTWLDPELSGAHCWVQADWGIKYDVWRVDPTCLQPCYEDDQRDIDEIEERHLLHQGTANELEPWITPKLEDYNPATDTLEVPVAVLGGGSIQDNDVVEITWYSEKFIEENSDGPGWGCHRDTIVIGDVTYVMWSASCSYDYESQEMHIYNQGVTDWASNSGSAYVEQRFIVDMSGPACNILSPAATVEPTGELAIEVTFADPGVGINPATVSVTVVDPDGNTIIPTITSSTPGRITAVVPAPLKRGEYQIKVSAQDYLGNTCNSVKTVRVEASVLSLAGAKMTPNPFNPNDLSVGYAQFYLGLTRTSYVTVKVYDFAGLEVATLKSHVLMSPGADVFGWGGQADDGTNLANGAYIVRVTAEDEARIAETNLKVVIWRE